MTRIATGRASKALHLAGISVVLVGLAGGFCEYVRADEGNLQHEVLWRYRAPSGACEIAAYSPATGRLFVTVGGGVDVVSLSGGSRLDEIAIPTSFHATSVACFDDALAVAWAADDKHNRGRITFYNAGDLTEIACYAAGFLPDMITFSPDGQTLLAANEGEPTDDYTFDPEGSITIITADRGWEDASVREAAFTRFNDRRSKLIAAGLHIFGPNKDDLAGIASIAQDVEPEYIAVSNDSRTAWITLQENNAIAEFDINKGEVTAIHPLGMKSFRSLGKAGQLISYSHSTGLDVSDKDGTRIRHWPIWGMYQPDGIATFREGGQDYLVTANEGDPRDYYDFHEVVPIGNLGAMGIELDASNPAHRLVLNENLGRLEISRYAGDIDGDGDLDRLVCPGTRSFSIWKVASQSLELVYDSGSDMEAVMAHVLPARYNADSTSKSPPDARSPVRGPEPENLALLSIGRRRFVAIGLERAGGAMVYDITRPREPAFLDYLSPYDAGGTVDLAPEGVLSVPAELSPNGKPLLILCNEGSGTMTAYEVTIIEGP